MIWLLVLTMEPYSYYDGSFSTPDIQKATRFTTSEEAQNNAQCQAFHSGRSDEPIEIYVATPYYLETSYIRQETTTRDPRESN